MALFLLGVGCAPEPRTEEAVSGDGALVLDGGNVFDGTGGPPLLNARVVVQEGRIACVGDAESCPIPDGAEVMDLSEAQWVLPGLVDAHVHFAQTGWFDGRPDTLDFRDRRPYEVTQAEQQSDPDRYYRSYLCSGVTAVFDVGGYPWSWDLRGPAENNRFAPHVAAAGPLITHAPRDALNLPAEQQMLMLSDEEAGRDAVRYMAAMGTDAIKVWFLRVPEDRQREIDARVKAVAEEAAARNVPLIVHATSLREAKVAVRAGAHLLVHGVDDVLVDDEFLTLAKERGTIYSPTLLVSDGYLRMFEAVEGVTEPAVDDPNGCIDVSTRELILSSPELSDHPSVQAFQRDLDAYRARLDEAYERKTENLRRVHAAGIPIAMGTDAGNPGTFHGPSVYAEIEAMQASAIEASDVLVMATRNGARAMGRHDDIGTLEEGKIADLIVVDGNPLEDVKFLRNLTHVVRAGHLHAIETLTASP